MPACHILIFTSETAAVTLPHSTERPHSSRHWARTGILPSENITLIFRSTGRLVDDSYSDAASLTPLGCIKKVLSKTSLSSRELSASSHEIRSLIFRLKTHRRAAILPLSLTGDMRVEQNTTLIHHLESKDSAALVWLLFPLFGFTPGFKSQLGVFLCGVLMPVFGSHCNRSPAFPVHTLDHDTGHRSGSRLWGCLLDINQKAEGLGQLLLRFKGL